MVAYAITLHGAVYAPILDRIEREIELARKADPVARARAILGAYATEGDLNGMAPRVSAFLPIRHAKR